MSEKKALVSIVVDWKWIATDVMEPFDVPTGEYHVTVGGRPCNGWCRALTRCAAAHDGTSIRIEVVQKPQFQIHVKTLTGKKISLIVNRTWTVGKLKTLIEEHEGFLCDIQRLFFAEKRLEDEKHLLSVGSKISHRCMFFFYLR